MFHFRRLAAEEEELGHGVLVDSVAWQRSRGIQLWDSPLPRDVYAARQVRGENFGLFEAEQTLVAVVSLLARVPDVWCEQVTERDAPWFATLAVATHARRIGHHAVEAACCFLMAEQKGALYLDCARGFLESFYREHGFRTLAHGTLHNATTNNLPAVLMVRDLVPA